ncbi:ABC transporter permease subunit [Ostreiculturibacter nitratireducens]|uniref:amino acid ABC transporter permease n=1 Tax=Ostreiculturibacter nitratireducens TaxID=3075226 RepID=UPI0031B63372
MATASDAPKAGFRPSMLIYDTRYRSITIQVFVLILFVLGLVWLLDNTAKNLAAVDKDFNFGFLWTRAGYDINQRLVEYTNDSTHGRALLIGILNTLLVAVLGCILATVVGVLAGILRLSRNWLISRMMTVYVEIFRNIPVLLWILLIFVILTETTPSPRDFRVTDEMIAAGEAPKASPFFFDSIVITNRSAVIPEPLFTRSLGNIDIGIFLISIDLLAFLAAIAAGVFANRALVRHAQRVQEATGIRPVTWWKSILLILGPPILTLYALGFYLGYGELAGFNFVGGIQVLHSFTALWLALSLYTGAFIAENVRAGILSVSKGQTEAASALGLRPGRTMRLVILPQALRVIIPPLISQYLNLTKNTSLAAAVSYMDIKGTLGGITMNQTGRELECMLLMMLIYLVLSLMISTVINIYNHAIRLKER